MAVSYWQHFGLEHDPFADDVSDAAMFAAPEWEQHLELLQHLSRYSHVLLQVLGPEGIGKSTLKQQFLTQMSESLPTLSVNADAELDVNALMDTLEKGFSLNALEDGAELTARLDAIIESVQQNDQDAVFVIDDAKLLPTSSLKAVIQLLSMQNDDKRCLHVLLFGDAALEEEVEMACDHVGQNVERHSIELEPFSQEETNQYIQQRLLAAGLQGDMPLSNEQIVDVYERSNGLPGEINQVAAEVLTSLVPVEEEESAEEGEEESEDEAADVVDGEEIDTEDAEEASDEDDDAADEEEAVAEKPAAEIPDDSELDEIAAALAAARGEELVDEKTSEPETESEPEPEPEPEVETKNEAESEDEPEEADSSEDETEDETMKANDHGDDLELEVIDEETNEPAELQLEEDIELELDDDDLDIDLSDDLGLDIGDGIEAAEPSGMGHLLRTHMTKIIGVVATLAIVSIVVMYMSSPSDTGKTVQPIEPPPQNNLEQPSATDNNAAPQATTATPVEAAKPAVDVTQPLDARPNTSQAVTSSDDFDQLAKQPQQTPEPKIAEPAPKPQMTAPQATTTTPVEAAKPEPQATAPAQQTATQAAPAQQVASSNTADTARAEPPAPKVRPMAKLQPAKPAATAASNSETAQPAVTTPDTSSVSQTTPVTLDDQLKSTDELIAELSKQLPDDIDASANAGSGSASTMTNRDEPTSADASNNAAASAGAAKPVSQQELTAALTAQSTSPTAASTSATTFSDLSSAERSLMAIDSSHYGLQLVAVGNQANLDGFIKTNKLEGSAFYYKTTRQGRDWYVLIYGDFASRAAAKAAVGGLPVSLQKLKPWARSYADIQNQIKQAQ